MNKLRKTEIVIGILLVLSILLISGCNYQLPTDLGNNTLEGVSTIDTESQQEDIIIVEEPVGDDITTDVNEPDTADEPVGDDTTDVDEPDTTDEPADVVDEPVVTQPVVPSTSTLPKKVIPEGELVSFPNLKANDADGDPIQYTFSAPLDTKGEWQTKIGDAGEYKITITASDGQNSITQELILVINNSNNMPVMEEISDITIEEGDVVLLNPIVTDNDNDNITITYSGWMNAASYRTTKDDSGTYTVVVTASDGRAEISQEVSITINDVNRAPLIADFANIVAYEGDTITLNVVAADPDGDSLAITYSGNLFNNEGIWETQDGDKGAYTITVTASDGKLTASRPVKINVKEINLPPVLEEIADITVDEGDLVRISASATDPENDNLEFTFSGWMATSTRTTDYDDAGVHTVTVTVSDGVNQISQNMKVTVNDKNQPPVFDPGSWN